MPAATDLMAQPNEIVCYSPTMITTNGVWQGDNPLDFSFPLFVLQLMIIVITTRLLVYLLKPVNQPRVVAEILVTSVFLYVQTNELIGFSSSVRVTNLCICNNDRRVCF